MNHTSTRRLSLESLENRLLLATCAADRTEYIDMYSGAEEQELFDRTYSVGTDDSVQIVASSPFVLNLFLNTTPPLDRGWLLDEPGSLTLNSLGECARSRSIPHSLCQPYNLAQLCETQQHRVW